MQDQSLIGDEPMAKSNMGALELDFSSNEAIEIQKANESHTTSEGSDGASDSASADAT